MKILGNVGMIETYLWSYVQFFWVFHCSYLLNRLTMQQSPARAPQSIGRVAKSA